MSTLGAEQREIVASFAAEIQPLLVSVVHALHRLADYPGDAATTASALADLRTLEAVVGFLELPTVHELLGIQATAIRLIGAVDSLPADARSAAQQLGSLLSEVGATLASGDADHEVLTCARSLVGQIEGASATVPAAPPASTDTPGIDAWLATLDDPAAAIEREATPLKSHDLAAETVLTLSPLDGAEPSALGLTVDDLLATLDDSPVDTARPSRPDGTQAIPPVLAPGPQPEPADNSAAQQATQPLPVLELDSRTPLLVEGERLAGVLATFRDEMGPGAFDDSMIVELRWAARATRAAAARLDPQSHLGEVCDLLERWAERAGEALPESDTLAFLTTAEEVVRQLLAARGETAAGPDLTALLALQLAAIEGEPTATSAGLAGWTDLPPDVLAAIDGVEIEDLDDEALARIASLLEAYDAAGASSTAVPPVAVTPEEPAATAPAGTPPLELAPLEVELPAIDWALQTDLVAGAAPAHGVAQPDADDLAFEAEVRAVFRSEAEEHLTALNEALLERDADPDDPAPLAVVRRAVHTLKGASAAVGMLDISAFCHVWEDALEGDPSAISQSLLMECVEALERYLAHPESPTAAADFADLARRLALVAPAGVDGSVPDREDDHGSIELPDEGLAILLPSTSVLAPRMPTPPDVREVHLAPAPLPSVAPEDVALPRESGPADVLRVPLERVDALVGLVAELVVQRSGLVEHLARLGSGLDDLDPILARLRRLAGGLDDRFGFSGDLRALPRLVSREGQMAAEFDELELDRYGEAYQISREILELAADLATTRRELGNLLEDVQHGVLRQGRTTTRLHELLVDMRLVPVALLSARLQRTVRQAALATGKDVTLSIEGGQTLLDKTLLEGIADPLLHLLRNAVDHGIEVAAERQRRGKAATGAITLAARRDGKEIVVSVHDDGAGIDTARVLARARERGLLAPDAPDDPSRVGELIFEPGLSTATAITELSGRGVGLDVVRTRLAAMRGMVTVTSVPGQGTRFTLRVPSLLVVTPVLLVLAGGQRVGLPIAQVRGVRRIPRDELLLMGEVPTLVLDGTARPLRSLATLLGTPSPVADWPAALLVVQLGIGDTEVALVLDRIVGQHEAIVQNPVPPFDTLHGLAGASILGNGEVVPVLNLFELLGEPAGRAHAGFADPPLDAADPPPAHLGDARTALVVDDSLSVRRVVSRTLTQHGWRVREARDGVQALALLHELRPDIMLLDVEMPRMDGFEVASTVRRDAELADLPIVMLTSRGGDKHRRKAEEIGVNAYLVKPYQEATLLATLDRFVGVPLRSGG